MAVKEEKQVVIETDGSVTKIGLIIMGVFLFVLVAVALVAVVSSWGRFGNDRHCLDWGGMFAGANHAGFERLVQERLNDPESMETLSTELGRLELGYFDGGRRSITMEFTARNSFGGRIQGSAKGYLDDKTCKAMLVSID